MEKRYKTPTGWILFRLNEQGHLHSEEGPAVETSHGRKEWRENGELHRENGPAIEDHKDYSWYIRGQFQKWADKPDTSEDEPLDTTQNQP